MDKQLRWDKHFLRLAQEHAKMSKDPSTKVGAVIVGPNLELRSAGFNGFPSNVADLPHRLHDRNTKLDLIIHGEMNAILAAARVGIPLDGCSMYILATDQTGSIWGGPPCIRCTVHALQTGIVEFVSLRRKAVPSSWTESLDFAEAIIGEAGAKLRFIENRI
jgi:dCMP deaminase